VEAERGSVSKGYFAIWMEAKMANKVETEFVITDVIEHLGNCLSDPIDCGGATVRCEYLEDGEEKVHYHYLSGRPEAASLAWEFLRLFMDEVPAETEKMRAIMVGRRFSADIVEYQKGDYKYAVLRNATR
jgi:hypothetical protein